MDMVVMVTEEAMEAMVVMDMARERLKLMLSQDTEAMDMVVMEEVMEGMVDTEAMVVMDMEREMLKRMLNQDTEAMDMVVMDMAGDLLMLSQDTEAMDMGYGYGRSYGGY